MIAAGRKIHKKTSFVLITSKYVCAWLKTQNLLKFFFSSSKSRSMKKFHWFTAPQIMMMIILHLWCQAQPAGETVSGRHYWQTAMPCALMILVMMMIILLLLRMMIMTMITLVVILLMIGVEQIPKPKLRAKTKIGSCSIVVQEIPA